MSDFRQAETPALPNKSEFRKVNRRGGVYPRPQKGDQQTSIQYRVGQVSLPAKKQAQRPVLLNKVFPKDTHRLPTVGAFRKDGG